MNHARAAAAVSGQRRVSRNSLHTNIHISVVLCSTSGKDNICTIHFIVFSLQNYDIFQPSSFKHRKKTFFG